MSILTRHIIPVPSFRTPYPEGPDSTAPGRPTTPIAIPPAQSEPLPAEPVKRTRNTRHPTTMPVSRPKPRPDPKRGGHPRAVASTVRDVKIVISVSREEAAAWHTCAKKDERSMAEWIRRTIFDVAKVAPRPHPERDVAMGSIDSRNSKG